LPPQIQISAQTYFYHGIWSILPLRSAIFALRSFGVLLLAGWRGETLVGLQANVVALPH